MGSFWVGRSGTSPEGDGSCGQRCTSCGRPQTRDSAHFPRISQLTALEGKKMPNNRGQGSSDLAAGAAVRAAVFGLATLAHTRRTERPCRHLICNQHEPSMRLGRSSSARSAAPAHPAQLFLTGRTHLGRGSLACISPHLTGEARDTTAMTSLRWLAVLDVGSSTPARAKRLAPRPAGPLPHFVSPRGEKCRPGLSPPCRHAMPAGEAKQD